MNRSELAKRTMSSRTLAWLCVAALLVSLLPLYAISFYNHAQYGDYGFSVLTHETWQETGDVLATLEAAFENTAGIRHTWEGTYAASFFSALQPALFGGDWYWVTTLVLLTFFLVALWFFMKQVLVHTLRVDGSTFWMALCAVAFVMIQFVPEMSEAFFWFNGGVAYTLLWSMMLVRIGVWIRFKAARTAAGRAVLYVLLLALTIVVGGAKYSTLLFASLLDALMVLYAFANKRRTRWLELAVFVLLMACFLFSAMAPGNALRSASDGADMPVTLLQALYFGLSLAGSWFSLPLLVVWALVAWQLSEALHGSPYRFNHPIWITLLSICLFCAQLIPALHDGATIGDGRTVNTYFYTFVLMGCALALYWMGWLMRKLDGRTHFAAIGTVKRDRLRMGILVTALVLLLIGCLGYQREDSDTAGLQNLASGSALQSLLSGEAAAYDEAMEERHAALNDPLQPEVVLEPIESIPDAFMSDALDGEDVSGILELYKEYYNKQSVRVAEGE